MNYCDRFMTSDNKLPISGNTLDKLSTLSEVAKFRGIETMDIY